MTFAGRLQVGLSILVLTWACGAQFASSQEQAPTDPAPQAAEDQPADQPEAQPEQPAEEPETPPKEEPKPEESAEPAPQQEMQEQPSAEAPEDKAEPKPQEEKPAAEPNADSESKQEPQEEPPAEKPAPVLPDEVVLKQYVTIPLVGIYGRASVHIDPVDAAIAEGEFSMPEPGDKLTSGTGREVTWRSASTGDDGVLSTRSIRGGYAATTFESPTSGIMLLEATGHAMVYVNNLPYAGDPYAYGDFVVPVQIKEGTNTLVFHVAQSKLQAKLVKPTAELVLSPFRTTLPSLVRGAEASPLWASVTLTNTTESPLDGLSIEARLGDLEPTATPLTWLDGACLRSCAFQFATPEDLPQDITVLQVRVVRDSQILVEGRFDLEVVDASAMQTRTFRSDIDGSVQAYVVVPALNSDSGKTHLVARTSDEEEDDKGKVQNEPAPGAIVALHTDGMTARDFAAQYQAKDWAHVIVPGGRGEFPLDWEEWSRLDAIEAMTDALDQFRIDEDRMYVTGHGMGGHGALVLATSLPGRFAALATTAAWPSLWSYGGGMPDYDDPSPVQAMLHRAASPSDILSHLSNLWGTGVMLMHGSQDEQIPPEQSRLVVKRLATWHSDFAYLEKPDAGNWWGAETVDNPELMGFLASRARSSDSQKVVKLSTSDLGMLSQSDWVTIAAQQTPFETSSVELEVKNTPLSIVGTTKNVQRLVIDQSAVPKGKSFILRLDGGQPVMVRQMPSNGQLWLERSGDRWLQRPVPDSEDKNPDRYGGMKGVFNHDVLLVYGTLGNDQENAWSRAKAHYDAQTFAYRAGGSLEVLSDTEFDPNQAGDRNVVVYGNVDTNRACAALLSSSPVQAFRDRIRVDTRPESGDDIGFVVVRPRSGNDDRLVAMVGGTGIEGMRLTNRLRYFWAGTAYPDLLIVGPEALTTGDGGVRAAGYFAEDWDVDKADIAWRDLAL
ncbi:prolyl oligopeptidase family serine peptidase [Aeoliella sp. ICT_H6.2]|uniref:Prolyl oligopeptidase family serine peptidase n=1 Tax=Aeoliella straminimaris TaxID=2954799 RepID=A0A9X2F5D2_9BACT|nr:prolyl oligopeptidase family serine peptidase [Aeoliella straminimaris]MCO6042480.1 prolyl oligopeptidase family serine peptidase [Aeoliella straminimaris]